MPRVVFRSPRAAERLERARAWLSERRADEELLVIGASNEAASALTRSVASQRGASFGWHRATLGRLAAMLAAPELAERNLAPVGPLPLEALASRVVHALAARGALGRFTPLAEFPGLSRAVARTLLELRLEGVGPAALRGRFPEFVELHTGYEEELARAHLADRALVYRIAIEACAPFTSQARGPAKPLSTKKGALEKAKRAAPATATQLGFSFGDAPREPEPPAARSAGNRAGTALALVGKPLLVLDAAITSALERDLVFALVSQAEDVLVTVPEGDERTLAALGQTLGESATWELAAPASTAGEGRALERLQRHVFSQDAAPEGTLDEGVTLLSAPGESREAVEIARRIRAAAERGVRFDRMAVLLRAPNAYRSHLEEALRRASIPAYFARGSVRPDPSGRAFLALLACASDKLSARRFAEYLSLSQVPDADRDGAPPQAAPDGERHVPPDLDLVRASSPWVEADGDDEEQALPDDADRAVVVAGALRAPRRWEQLLVEASVIGGLDRWRDRLGGLEEELACDARELGEDDDARREGIARRLGDLRALKGFALPLLDALANLPERATWGEWLQILKGLAERSIRHPDRIHAVLAELDPMAKVGKIELADVALVLRERLTDLVALPATRSEGRVFVAPIAAARGLAFDVVFVPGLAERIFPQKVAEDPILRDEDRLTLGLPTNKERAQEERLALRLAIGAASERVVLSYPRIDLDASRPRVPSFYGLEVLRAAEGKLPGFDELARRAEGGGAAARIGWPAPASPELAIDEAEYDLALLARLFRLPEGETVGAAHYLLSHPHLGRALRFRARRWDVKKWTSADGLVEPHARAAKALDAHAMSARSFSATALQHFAACPYRFLLNTVLRLSAREDPEAIEELSPLEKGSLVHEVLYLLCTDLRDKGMLPLDGERLGDAAARLEEIVNRVAASYASKLAPAIPRVWEDGIQSIKADLREWLRRSSEEPAWNPTHLELSFGLEGDKSKDRDAMSTKEPVALDCGIRLRGSIDVVEKHTSGRLRATDYKTGKKRAKATTIIGGGKTLQPVLYALALEKLFRGEEVEGGRLYYATSAGGFEGVEILLDKQARDSATALAEALHDALTRRFFPAAPEEEGCMYCDYKAVCGPHEELRAKRKQKTQLVLLKKLRELP